MKGIDMSTTTIARSDQLNAIDILGSPLTITVRDVTGNAGEQPISFHYEGDNGKPWKPCKTIRRLIIAVWGKYTEAYKGRSLTLYRDERVSFGGMETGGIRVSHMSHIDKETVVVLPVSRNKSREFRVK